jgi:hypothetical protein
MTRYYFFLTSLTTPQLDFDCVYSVQTHVLGYIASEFVVGILCIFLFVLCYVKSQLLGSAVFPSDSIECIPSLALRIHRIAGRKVRVIGEYLPVLRYHTTLLEVEELGTSCPLCIDGIMATGQTGGNIGSCILVFVA